MEIYIILSIMDRRAGPILQTQGHRRAPILSRIRRGR